MVELTYQEIIGGIAFLISLVGSLIYIKSILKGETTPHLFTWIIFGILTTIAFLAQIHDHGGPGAWSMGITALSCISIAVLSLKYGEKIFTLSDKIAFGASLTAILPWLLTDDPLGSVVLISLIDTVAMFPTLRKSWNKPYGENLTTYGIANVKTILSLAALTNLTLTTTLYPVAITLVNTGLIILCLWRRKALETNI
ncbi:MAG: hypothetical protein WC043_01130 [Pseudobdellovibrionaceae bacterium]